MRRIPRWAFCLAAGAIVFGAGWYFDVGRFAGDNWRTLLDSVGISHVESATTSPKSRRLPSAYRVAEIELRRIVQSVDATGAVAPVALFSVGSQVSGQVKEVYADFNKEVARGEPLALIDPLSFEIAVEQAEAQMGVAKAGVAKAEVLLLDAETDLARKSSLIKSGSVAQAEVAKATAARDLAQTERDNAFYALKNAKATLRQATADLDRTLIRSPVDGTVIVRAVEVGTNVAVSLQAPILFTVAKDLKKMQINTSVPEGEIGRIRTGQQVQFTVDSYPGRLFRGEVEQVRKQPQTSQNVVTYTVIVSAPNPELLLLPGMTATTKIIIEAPDPKLAVPTAALRFRPPGVARAVGARIFLERDGEAVAVPVLAGASDELFTAVNGETLVSGDMVITGLAAGDVEAPVEERRKILGLF